MTLGACSSPRLSIILPVHDPDALFFSEAIESLLAQTFGDFEVIIVEAPSQRRAADVLDRYPDRRLRHWRHEERSSACRQRNEALARCRAPLVAMMDADDVCEPNRLRQQMAFMDTHEQVDVVGTQLRIIDATGTTIGYRRYPSEHRQIIAAMRRFNPMAHPSVMARKGALDGVGGYRPRGYAEDYDLWCRLARAGARFANVGEPLLRYRLHEQAVKATATRQQLRDTLRVKTTHFGAYPGVRASMRMLAERGLTLLPPTVTYWLFKRSVIARRPPR